MGPTGKMRAAGRAWSRARLIAWAISWPITTSRSATDSQATGSNRECHQACRSPIARAGCEQHASILARSQPRGKKPSIIEPAIVVSKFIIHDISIRW
jgi:hypothetical protein